VEESEDYLNDFTKACSNLCKELNTHENNNMSKPPIDDRDLPQLMDDDSETDIPPCEDTNNLEDSEIPDLVDEEDESEYTNITPHNEACLTVNEINATAEQTGSEWIIDSGSSVHVCNDATKLNNPEKKTTKLVGWHAKQAVTATARGSVRIGNSTLHAVNLVPTSPTCLPIQHHCSKDSRLENRSNQRHCNQSQWRSFSRCTSNVEFPSCVT
jgi:hypothetical protein